MKEFNLKEFELDKKPFTQAENAFWRYFNSWREEEPEEFNETFKANDLSLLVVSKEKIAYVINYSFDHPVEYVTTTLNVIVDNTLIAQYHYLQHLNGDVMDDVLSFER